MNQKKGNATILFLAKIAFLLFAMTSNTAHATTYTVGDSTGWIFNVAGWENGKSFKAGDTLGKLILFLFDKELINNNSLIISIYIYIFAVFNYAPGRHSVVVVVDKASYDSCSVPTNATLFTSGNDQITLKQGENYFICGFTGHCDRGMKIAANAA